MRLKKGLLISAIATAGMLVLGGCASGGEEEPATPVKEKVEFEAGTTMAELNEAGKITIGTKFDQPLFGLAGLEGSPEGFDVEMGIMIAAELGISEENIEWVETVSANREPFIQNGTVDLVIATYTINDKRKEVIDFAGPYYNAGQDLLVLAGNPENVEGPEDLADLDVCTVTGSTSFVNISEYKTKSIIQTDAYGSCLEPLRTGAADVLTTDNVILAGLAAQNEGEFEVVGNPFTEEPYGIGLAKGDDAFRTWINDLLEASFEDGRWVKAWEATAGTVLKTPEPPAVNRY
ncbi:MAG: transporter substrate-binding protein [Homoserinimonas sp.]|nr:transporter substrate-binding protein [Homoserinimonas sp.]